MHVPGMQLLKSLSVSVTVNLLLCHWIYENAVNQSYTVNIPSCILLHTAIGACAV